MVEVQLTMVEVGSRQILAIGARIYWRAIGTGAAPGCHRAFHQIRLVIDFSGRARALRENVDGRAKEVTVKQRNPQKRRVETGIDREQRNESDGGPENRRARERLTLDAGDGRRAS